MSAAILITPPATESLRRKLFTRSEVDRMQDMGIFDGQRCELIEGELIDKLGQNPPHSLTIQILMTWLSGLFGAHTVRVQLPIEAAAPDQTRSLPEPDLTVLNAFSGEYGKRHPGGDELALLIEGADSSLHQDLVVKRPIYARAAVPEYWVIDIPSRRLIIHRNPVGGDYRETSIQGEAESVACAAQPEGRILVKDFLP